MLIVSSFCRRLEDPLPESAPDSLSRSLSFAAAACCLAPSASSADGLCVGTLSEEASAYGPRSFRFSSIFSECSRGIFLGWGGT
jgi:hypothetical protein